MGESEEEIIDASRSPLFNWRELWRFRELFYFFAWRDIRVKYKQTILGFLWAVLQPVLMMVVFTLFFARALNVPSYDLPYPIYVFSGLIIWNIFSSGLSSSANSMADNASIIKKIYFPRLIIPVSSILVALFDFIMGFFVFLLILAFYGQPVSWTALYVWPVAILIAVIATLGPGCWLAALNIKYRDFRYMIPFLVQMLLFVTPVVYPVTILEQEWLRFAVAANPAYAAITLFRLPLSSVGPEPVLLLISLGATVFFLLVGVIYFRQTEMYFADMV